MGILRELGRELLPPIALRGLRKARALSLFKRNNHVRQAPSGARVQPVRSFDQIRATGTAIEGMMSTFAMQVIDCLLSFQIGRAHGHIVEFGSFHGRSASVLASRMRPDERLILVDPEDQIDRATLSAIRDFEFVKTSSEQFQNDFPDFDTLRNRCRFIHIDSSHFFATTLHELRLAESLIADGGIVALDDFSNLNFSQIAAALYRYLYTTDTGFCVFLVTEEKAYLCRKRDFPMFGDYVLHCLCDDMSDRAPGTGYCLARTNVEEGHRAFRIRPSSGDEDRFYGRAIYGHFYEEP